MQPCTCCCNLFFCLHRSPVKNWRMTCHPKKGEQMPGSTSTMLQREAMRSLHLKRQNTMGREMGKGQTSQTKR